jgi:hypothetical protein
MPSGSPVSVVFAADDTAPSSKDPSPPKLSGFASLSGSFAASKSGSQLTVAASNITAFVGSGSTGVQVTDGELGLVVNTTSKKFALVTSGDFAVTGVTGLTVTGSGSLKINRLGESINQTITTPDGAVTVSFPTNVDVTRAEASLALQFSGFVSASGNFLIEKVDSTDLTTIRASATNLDAFLGVNFNQPGEFGVRIDDAGFAMVIEKPTIGSAAFAVSSLGGSLSISGLPALDLDGPLAISINKLGHSIDVDIPTLDGTTIPIEFPTADPVQRLAGDVAFSVAGFTTLKGSFAFELDTATAGTTKVRVAGTNISALLGSDADGVIGTSDDVGAKITDGRIGAVFYKTSAGTSYALDAAGTASLVGVPGFTLSGSLAARVNTTGGAVSESITMPSGSPVSVVFAADDTAPVFKGSVTAEASGFASLSGGFAVSKSTGRLKIAVAGVTAFVGAGDTGLRLTGGNLGVVLNTNSKKYALVAGGSIALEGISGFSVGGSAAVRINTLGEAVNETISTPSGDVTVSFPTSAQVQQVSGSVSLSISDYVEASATITATKETVGNLTTLNVTASDATAFLGVGASTITTSDDMGVRLTGGALDLRWTKDTSANTSWYALGARGTASLVGISGLTLTGTLQAERNTGPNSVTLDFGTASTADDLTLAAGAKRFGGTAELAISGFVSVSGSFGFEESTETIGGVETTRIKVAAAGIQTFLGSGGTGVQLSNGQIGAVIDKPVSGDAKYAVVASGTASLTGISGLTLTGTMNARINRLGTAIDTVITTPAGPVQVEV